MKAKRLLGILVIITMLTSMIPTGFAASVTDFVDFPDGWSKPAMEAAVNNGLLYGFNNGEIRPQANLTRAEMAAVITRSFGAVTKSDISAFSDVSPSAWYYDSIAKAVKMGAMQGDSASTMSPEKPITREELFTVFARVLVLSSSNTAVLDKFKDASQISLWAKEGMAALVERGYVNGDNVGNVNPKANITREEFAQVMHNSIRTYITKPGTYTADMEGITVIRVGDVTVKDLTNTSDLVIGDGVLDGKIYITNVAIGERLLVRGGGIVTVKNSTLGDKVVVNNVNGTTHFNNYRSEKFFKGIVENTKATFLTAGGGSSYKEKATVTFYDGYPALILIDDVTVNVGGTVNLSDIPAIDELSKKSGYVEDNDFAEVYTDEEYTHKITPSYWYINSTNEFAPFDETVIIDGDTDVFLMTKMFMVSLAFESVSQPLSLLAYYNDDVRLADTAKDILYNGRGKLERASVYIPKYNEIINKVKGKLETLNLIDDADNIRNFKLSIPISDLVKEATVRNMVKEHIEDVIMGRDNNKDDVYSFILNMGIPGVTTVPEIEALLSGLSDNEKRTLAAEVYTHKESYQTYNNLIDSLMNEDEFEIKPDETDILINVAHAIEKLDYDKMMEQSSDNSIVNMLIDLIGEETFKQYFIDMRDDYAEGFIDAVEEVRNTATSKNYTTHLSLKINIVKIIENYYDKAQTKLISKLQSAGVKYNQNKYLEYLAEHDAFEKLFNKTTETEDLSGYQLKSELDYYDYMLGLVMVADDALTWYGNEGNVTEAEFNAVYEALFGFLADINAKLNEVMEAYVADGSLPSKIEKVVNSLEPVKNILSKFESSLKSLFTKYIDSEINIKIEDGTLSGNEKMVKVSDILTGKEVPAFTIDSLYSLLCEFDDNIQAKLKELKDSGKLKEIADKIDNTSFGELFIGQTGLETMGQKLDEIMNSGKVQSTLDSAYQMLVLLADHGIEVFKEDVSDITVIDSYKFEFKNVTLKIIRTYE